MYKPSQFQELLQNAETQTVFYRKTAFLKFIISNLMILHFIAAISLFFKDAKEDILQSVVILSISFILILIDYIITKKSIRYGAFFTILYFNIIIMVMFIANIIEETYYVAVVFGCLLALPPVIIGMLLETRYITFNGGINILYIIIVSFILDKKLDSSATTMIISMIFITTAISWYFQRSLQRSQQYIEKARSQIAQDTLLRQELAIARDLQSRLYPTPPQPGGGIVMRACALPALETSGDLYDFIILDEHRTGIVIADVTGKSIAAALLMAMTRATFRSEARRSTDPATVLTHVNAILCADDSIKQMVTAWYGIFDRRSLKLRFANAGHPFPLLLRHSGITELEAFGFPLRASLETVYQTQIVDLAPGDHLLLLTDGALEAMNTQREIFGYERLYSSFTEAAATRPYNILDMMQQSIAEFHNPAPQADDLTMILLSIDEHVQLAPSREKITAA